jgi:hypothetical protein
MPVSATISLVQNTIEYHSTSNYLYTYVNDELANSRFWTDNNLIAVSIAESGYSPTPVLKLNLGADGEITYERLIP